MTTPAGLLCSHTGPAPYDDAAVARWLLAGCPGPVPVRQGFAAALLPGDGTVRAASSARTEASLFWTTVDGQPLLASHPRDLISLLAAPPALDVGKLADLTALHDDRERTVWAGVHRLPTGYRLSWRPGDTAPDVRPWFTPDTQPDRSIGTAEAVQLMRTAVREAVEGSLPDRGDLHATLSGGLDSSMVSATAASLLQPHGRTVHALTHVPLPGTTAGPGWEADDGPYARQLCAEVPGFTWSAITNDTRRNPFAVMSTRFDRTWMPVRNPSNMVWVGDALDRAGSDGSSLLLTGATGNGPYSPGAAIFLAELARGHRYDQLTRYALRSLARGQGSRGFRAAAAVAAPKWVRAYRRRSRSPDATRETAIRQRIPVRPELLSAEASRWAWDQPTFERQTRQHWIDFVRRDHGLTPVAQLLSDTVWWSDPLSDPLVISLALRLPLHVWLAGGRPRGLAREAGAGLVPDHIRLRTTRGGQSLDRGQWLAGRQGELLGYLEEVEASPAAQQFLDLPALRLGVQQLDPASSDVHAWEMTTGRALGFGMYAAWYERQVLGAHLSRLVPAVS